MPITFSHLKQLGDLFWRSDYYFLEWRDEEAFPSVLTDFDDKILVLLRRKQEVLESLVVYFEVASSKQELALRMLGDGPSIRITDKRSSRSSNSQRYYIPIGYK
jgi:hypothetical protein